MADLSRSDIEHALVEAAQSGDQGALDRLLRDQLDRVKVFVCRKVPGDDVDDVVQEVLLSMIAMLPELKEPRAFKSSLWTIAQRRIADFYRTCDSAAVVALTAASDLDVEGQGLLERVEDRVTAKKLLEEMPRCSRVVLRLRIEKGWSFAQVGKRTGMSEGAARIRYYRTRSRIRQVWA